MFKSHIWSPHGNHSSCSPCFITRLEPRGSFSDLGGLARVRIVLNHWFQCHLAPSMGPINNVMFCESLVPLAGAWVVSFLCINNVMFCERMCKPLKRAFCALAVWKGIMAQRVVFEVMLSQVQFSYPKIMMGVRFGLCPIGGDLGRYEHQSSLCANHFNELLTCLSTS